MKKIKVVWKEVNRVTEELVRCGLAESYNLPMIRNTDIVWERYSDISRYLRNMSYSAIYNEIEKNHNYNIKLPDGGMLQMMYRFDRKGEILQQHRLAFYPSPSYELYQNVTRMYDEDELYGDVLNKSTLPVVLRVDYNSREVESKTHHPFVHITLGEYKNCRIPADKPVPPVDFVKFIIEHFYYVPGTQLKYNFAMESKVKFEEHIADCDREKSHMVI